MSGVDQIPDQIIIEQDGKQLVYEQVKIIESKTEPKFGTVAAIILAVAVISIIAVSARTRLSILPKY